MGKKYFLTLLILCAILTQVIASLSEENLEKSSDLQIRKKRLIDQSQFRRKGFLIEQIPYIVKLLKDGLTFCAGTILSFAIILTSAFCLIENAIYSILSGSPLLEYGNSHDIVERIVHDYFDPHTVDYDLAMLKISPPIIKKFSPNRPIQVSNKPVPENSIGQVSGWGCVATGPNNYKLFKNKLQSIEIPVIESATCQHIDNQFRIDDHHICTYDLNGEKRSCDRDGGDALVVNGKLAGVMSYRENSSANGNPQVFMNLANHEINAWIQITMKRLLSPFFSCLNCFKP